MQRSTDQSSDFVQKQRKRHKNSSPDPSDVDHHHHHLHRHPPKNSMKQFSKDYVQEELEAQGVKASGGDGVRLPLPETVVGLLGQQQQHSDQSLSDEDEDKEHHSSPNLKGDYLNICVLLFLYLLQGIPLGLSGAIPMILQNRKVSYREQAMFSLVNWPFSLKLLWAPIVDALFWARFGRRKSWLVPVQYLIGLTMLIVSPQIDQMLGGSEQMLYNQTHPTMNMTSTTTSGNFSSIPINASTSSTPFNNGSNFSDHNTNSTTSDNHIPFQHPRIYLLTAVFFFINFLCATQDVAVDGWALTMLSRRNVIYASTCNTVGQTAGYFLGNIVFLAFESADFCNSYFRSEPQADGFLTLPGFLYFWGLVFIVTTTLIMLFKTDVEHSADERDLRVLDTYKMLIRILKLPSVRTFALLLLTCKMGFAITDAASGLKLVEAGVHKENLALLAVPMVPLQIILPWIISRYVKSTRALNAFLQAYPYRLSFGIFYSVVLYWTRVSMLADGSHPVHYYAVILSLYALHQIAAYCMFVSIMFFFARVSDPAIGGTYMTLLNTVTNLGGMWPSTLSLWMLDYFTIRRCSIDSSHCWFGVSDRCSSLNGKCVTFIDGYYTETVFFMIIGLVWYRFFKRPLLKLQRLPLSAWKCK